MNIILLFSIDISTSTNVKFLAQFTPILFNIIYFLTFSSVVGAGVKYLNIQKTCRLHTHILNENRFD